MTAVTTHGDFGAQENKICHCFHFSPFICHEVKGPDTIIFIFWMLSFRPTFHSLLSPSSGCSLVPLGFPDSSVGKESSCKAGDPDLIPGLGRFPGEGESYPLQYSGLENSMDCNNSWGRKEWDTTKQLSLFLSSTEVVHVYKHSQNICINQTL